MKYIRWLVTSFVIPLAVQGIGLTAPKSKCYETRGKAVICLKEIAPDIFSAAVNKPNGKISKSGVLIPTIIIINCKTKNTKGYGPITTKEIKLLAQNICGENTDEAKKII